VLVASVVMMLVVGVVVLGFRMAAGRCPPTSEIGDMIAGAV